MSTFNIGYQSGDAVLIISGVDVDYTGQCIKVYRDGDITLVTPPPEDWADDILIKMDGEFFMQALQDMLEDYK